MIELCLVRAQKRKEVHITYHIELEEN